MADWLIIRLPRTPAEQASWIVADARGVAIEAPAAARCRLLRRLPLRVGTCAC